MSAQKMRRHGNVRRNFDTENNNKNNNSGHSININAGNSGDSHICQHCGKQCGGHHCQRPDPTPPWVIILKILIQFVLTVSIVIFVGWGAIKIYHMGCDECYERGYWDGYEAALDPYTSGLIGEEQTAEGGPCRRWIEDECPEAGDAREVMRWSRYYLYRGDAEIALVTMSSTPDDSDIVRRRRDAARQYYRSAIMIGSGVGSQASIYAGKRIQYLSMACTYDEESLSRIAREWEDNPLGDLIEMKQKQEALKALGYYNGPVDNVHSPQVRTAIREFQLDVGFSQTGVLSAEQTTLLICAGAQIAKSVGSQNVLGVMFAMGLGVRQNTDAALNWLEVAAQRGDADAYWNLAMLYGTQTVHSSVLICDAVQNAERADSYLREAVRGGHPVAEMVSEKYRDDDPKTRWSKISGDLNVPNAIKRVGTGCNPNG